jgi:uncharacterized protein
LGFHPRMEAYTPAPKRVYGYYTLPVLVDARIVARIDLKSDRQNRVLRVQSAWREPGEAPGYEGRIAALLRNTAAWQGLDEIEVMPRGDLADALAAELALVPEIRLTPKISLASGNTALAGDIARH